MNPDTYYFYKQLKWDDFVDWFEDTIVDRGQKYQNQGRVSDLAVTENGDLIAWVTGTKQYATTVEITEGKYLDSYCTCPYAVNCKHGVAVVLEYLEFIKQNHEPPVCSDSDERLYLLSDEEADPDIDIKDAKENMIGFLESRSKAQLIGIIVNLSRQYPEIAHDLEAQQLIGTKDIDGLEHSIRNDILEITREADWDDPWQEGGFTPDLSSVQDKLEALLKAGHPDKVLTLAEELVQEGSEIIEMRNDEGETAMDLSECMAIAFLALKTSKQDPLEKMSWALDRLLEDEYGICDPIEAYFFEDHDKDLWHQTADRIMDRLGMNGKDKQTETDDAWYPRSLLVKWAVYALEQAGRMDEILLVYRHDAEESGNVSSLVEELIRLEQYEDAEDILRSEIKRQEDKSSWKAIGLHSDLLDLMVKMKNWLSAAAISTESFIRHPSREKFIECRKLSKKAGQWKKIRHYLLLYLETGALPWKNTDWPLPSTQLPLPAFDSRKSFPKLDSLINIAIVEKQPAQILKWYDKLPRQQNRFYRINYDEIAGSIKEYDPLRAVSLWKQIAEHHIAKVKPKAYLEGAKALKKAAKVMKKENRQAEWQSYINQLKKEHKRKTRLMEVLNRLENNSIIGDHLK